MKTKLFFLVLFIGCFSCAKNNKQVSDAQKEVIKGEVKEVFSSIIKGAEAANFDLVVGHWLNSPDFLFVYNGSIFDYNQATEMGKSALGSLTNQQATITDERFILLDISTVLYTVNMKCTMNFKDGNVVLQDPWVSQYLFKKIDKEWKVLNANESGVEKNITPGLLEEVK